MTMDLLKIAEQRKVNSIVILTADTDFVPIIKDIREGHKIKVILGYFTDRKRKSAFSLSNYLWKECDYKLLIKREFFE